MFSTKIKVSVLTAAAVAMFAPLNQANATNGQLPSCVGTYKCGMAGAGLSIASDPTAATINPALAARMGNEAIINLGWFHADVERDLSATTSGNVNRTGGKQKSDASDFANGSLGVNYRIGDDKALNISIYPGGGGATNWDNSRTSPNTNYDRSINYKMINLQTALGYSPNETSSYGFGVVLSRSSMRTDSLDNQFGVEPEIDKTDIAYGVGFQVGGIWDAYPNVTLAADYHSRVWHERFEKYPSVFNSTVDRPATFSVGADWDATPTTILAFDYKHVFEGPVNTISQDPSTLGGFGWDDINIFMLGVQHEVVDGFQVRAGYSYGNSPIDEQHVFANILYPAIVEQHYTLGLSYAITDAMELGWSGYVTPTKKITDSGDGNTFSQMGSGSILWHRQYGTQASLKYNF